jgi:hypothetical protein
VHKGKPEIIFSNNFLKNIIFLKGFLLNCGKNAISDLKSWGLIEPELVHIQLSLSRYVKKVKISLDCPFK